MTTFDVFNGDADGLCALHQWRLRHPAEARRITGVKRDNALLKRVPAERDDEVYVFDIGMRPNAAALEAMLGAGIRVRWFDHHSGAEPPAHPLMQADIDEAADVCTSVIVDRAIDGLHRPWAVVGAFGDNLAATARRLAATLTTDAETVEYWRRIGETLNYNAYGASVADLVFDPADVYRAMEPYDDPIAFANYSPLVATIEVAMRDDLRLGLGILPSVQRGHAAVYELPAAPWARRVAGTLANRLAPGDSRAVVAVLTPDPDGGVMVSLRVPPDAPETADAFARRFGGGGRRCAAGIANWPSDRLRELRSALLSIYGG